MVAWAIMATAILLMDSIGSGNFREQVRRDQATYTARLNDLSAQRDTRAEEALAAQERFNAALAQISAMQSLLLASENRRRELETGIEVIQTTLRGTMKARQTAQEQVAALQSQVEDFIRIELHESARAVTSLGLADHMPASPFSDREFIELALKLPLGLRSSEAFAEALLLALDPALAGLPYDAEMTESTAAE